jgi:anti-sigma B factor antagonist
LQWQKAALLVSLKLVTRLREGHVVVALRGELDITCSADVASAIAALMAPGQVVIVDLSALEFMDCASLGALLKVRAVGRQARSDVWLAAPTPIVQRLLRLTGLDDVLGVHRSVDAAVLGIGGFQVPACQGLAASMACAGSAAPMPHGSR